MTPKPGIRVKISAVLLLAVVISACTDSSLQKVAQAVGDYQSGLTAIQNTLLTANQQGTITNAEAAPLVSTLITLNQGGQQASAAIRNINALSPTDKTKLLAILPPLVTAVQNAINANIVAIKNKAIHDNLLLALTGVQTALNTVQIVLAAKS